MSEHLARHVLERLLVDDPRDPVPAELRGHLPGCDRCEQRMHALMRARAEFASARPAARFARLVAARAETATRGRPLRWASFSGTAPALRGGASLRWPLVAAALAAALVALGLRSAWLAPDPDPDAIRYKGASAELHVYVRRGAQTRALRSGEGLAAGDQLAFAYTLSVPQHLLMLGIDDAGTISRYFPDGTLAKTPVLPAGGTHQLPVGIELDGRRGQERLVALFSAAPIDETRARAALSAALQQAHVRGQGIRELGELSLPATQVSIWFEKP